MRDYLELHHDNSIINMLKLVKNTVNVLELGESEVFKSEYVLELYKSLYTGRADLTEPQVFWVMAYVPFWIECILLQL